jgi:hypothetical protein
MRNIWYRFVLLSALSAYGQSANQPNGSICGTVLDENGLPARLIKVIAIREGASGPPEVGKTDESGHYCIGDLAPGDYVMSADDTDHGYPITASHRGGFFYLEPTPQQKVRITSVNLTGHADWRIPYKVGWVKVKLTDALTGKVIPDISFRLTNTSGGVSIVTRPSITPILIPPNSDFYLEVSAPGYRSWPEEGTKGMRLNLRPGETQTIEIALSPS